MSYAHAKVTDIEKTTKQHIASIAGTLHTTNESDPPVNMVDGIPVESRLALFCAALRKTNRHIKFGVGKRGGGWSWESGAAVAKELWVYMEGQTYAMMRVGYGDYSLKSGAQRKFMVYARMISNEKFNEARDQYYMAVAETPERALKNAKKYMRPYSPLECASMTFDQVCQRFASTRGAVSSALYEAKDNVQRGSQMRVELFHMIDMGYEFLSEDFRDKLVKWRDAYNEDQIARARALHVYYVGVRIQRDEMVCDVIEVLDAHNLGTLKQERHTATTYKMEELPESIAGGLAVLSMTEDDHYVDGVGLRVDSSTFWVQR